MLTQSVATASILLTEPTETVIATVNDIAPVGAGAHNVEASYSGDGSYSPEVSGTIPPTAALAPTVFAPTAGTYSTPLTITISECVPWVNHLLLGFWNRQHESLRAIPVQQEDITSD
jgi:hypothetical protein